VRQRICSRRRKNQAWLRFFRPTPFADHINVCGPIRK
jgi:hypothetical protein